LTLPESFYILIGVELNLACFLAHEISLNDPVE
jgi:hypothetical protein